MLRARTPHLGGRDQPQLITAPLGRKLERWIRQQNSYTPSSLSRTGHWLPELRGVRTRPRGEIYEHGDQILAGGHEDPRLACATLMRST